MFGPPPNCFKCDKEAAFAVHDDEFEVSEALCKDHLKEEYWPTAFSPSFQNSTCIACGVKASGKIQQYAYTKHEDLYIHRHGLTAYVCALHAKELCS